MCKFLSGFYDKETGRVLVCPEYDSHSSLAYIFGINEDSERYWRFEVTPPSSRFKKPSKTLKGWSFSWDEKDKKEKPDLVNPKKWIAKEIQSRMFFSDKGTVYVQNWGFHRVDGPAVEKGNGTKYWYQNGQLHRVDGPAVEDVDGTKQWFQNNRCHRVDGPAVEYPDGTKAWYKNGQLHRVDGPAVERADGTKEWYQNGKRIG